MDAVATQPLPRGFGFKDVAATWTVTLHAVSVGEDLLACRDFSYRSGSRSKWLTCFQGTHSAVSLSQESRQRFSFLIERLHIAYSKHLKDIQGIQQHLSVSKGYASGMPITLRRKLVLVGNSVRVTVPPEILRLLEAKAGDTVEYLSHSREVCLRKVKSEK